MKKIGIDGRLLNQTGVGVYVRSLLTELQRIAPTDIEFYVYLRSHEQNELKIHERHFIKRVSDFRWHSLSEQFGFLKQLLADDLDLMHFTYFSYPTFYNRPFVSTIHDITPLLFKTGQASTHHHVTYDMKHAAYRFLMKRAVKNARAIITPTKTVKRQIIEHYGQIPEDKLFVTYEGINENLIETEENTMLSKQFAKPFFLYVSNFYPHKNSERLVEAFLRVKTDYELVLVGPDDYFSHRLPAHPRIRQFHNSTLEDFVFFYKNAVALVHPSLSEGFGLPIVEASYFSRPIIASNINVFTELLGSDRLTFDPLSVESITDALSTFLKNQTQYKNQFISKTTLQSTYSFPKMANLTLDLYKRFS